MSMNTVYPTVLTGTITGCRVSNVASYYFLDNLPAEVLQFAGSGDQLRIYDGSKWKVVTLGAKGTGESLDSTIFTNGDFTIDEPAGTAWTRGVGWTISTGKGRVTTSSVNSALTQSKSVGTGELFKTSFTIESITGAISSVRYNSLGASLTFAGAYVDYYTVPSFSAGGYGVSTRGGVSTTAVIDDLVGAQVLTPSASGLWYTPISEESGWNPNAASHTYKLLARRIASGAGGYLK